jgi:hypothetical protein
VEQKNSDWIYDLETYPNCFTFTIVRCDSKFLSIYEISARKNETDGMLKCLRYLTTEKQRMVGFNNIGFDYPIVHYILEKAIKAKKNNVNLSLTAQELYDAAQKQIASFRGEGFGNTIPDDKVIIKQVDLYKIHHFDNKARATSLKMLEFNMCSENIEDLPFPVGTVLTNDEMDKLVFYNQHDVKETLKFYNESLDAIRFRAELSEKLGKDFTNANDTKVGKDYFIMKLEKMMPGSCYKQAGYHRVVQQSKRDYIDLKDCLFNYYDFKRPEFQAIVEWFKNQRITETKGVFSDIEEHNLGEVAKYANLRIKRQKFKTKPTDKDIADFKKDHPMGWIEEVPLKSGGISYWKKWKVTAKSSDDGTNKEGTLNVVIDGFQFDFGTGGIHGSVNNSVVYSNEEYLVIDADVSSMYPNIAISNRIYPEHLTAKFCDIYENVYEQRKQYAKGTPENALFKLALNGVYGDSNNQYSPFYDPKYTMMVTINGQLSLCLLAERLMDIEGLSIIQVNTDGVTVKLPRNKRDQYDTICGQWQKDVKLELEFAEYKAMYIRDVNNYIALYSNSKVKRKGAYEYENLGWHQNHSAKIIPMAAEAAMVHGKDVSTFICSHENKWDFLLRTKVNRDSRLIMVNNDGTETLQQNICRYYPSKRGGKLIKIMPPLEKGKEERRLSIDKDWNVKTCNNILDFKWDIDYAYYIEETKKLIIDNHTEV